MALKYAVKSGDWSGTDVWGIILTGTLDFTNASTTVNGTGTLFSTELAAGDYIFGADGVWYQVSSITSDTSLELASAYAGATSTGNTSYKQTSAPVSTDDAIINSGITVSLDNETSDITINSLEINGTLEYTSSALSSIIFDAGTSITINGSLLVGTSIDPIGSSLGLEIKADSWTIASGAEVKCYGYSKTNWTQLNGAVSSGSSSIIVDDATGWAVGDEIVLCTTSVRGESEKLSISAISGTTITLSTTISYDHADNGYVLNLTRNVKLTGDGGDLSYFRANNVLNNVEVYNFGTISHSESSSPFSVDGCVFYSITKPINPYYGYNIEINNSIFYECDYVSTITGDNDTYSCIINNIFLCKRKSATLYTFLTIKQPSNNYNQNIYICDIQADTVMSVSTYGFIKNLNIWAVATPWNKSIISSRGIYINGLNLYEWGTDSSSRLFNGDALIADSVTIGSGYTAPKTEWSLSNAGYKAISLGFATGWCNYYRYGEVCSSGYLGVTGNGGSGEALAFSPNSSSEWLYFMAETNALLLLLHNLSFPVNSGKTITLTFYVKVSDASFDGDLQIAAEGCGIDYSWTSVDLSGGTTWTQVSHTLGTTTDKGFVRLKIRAKDGATVSGDIYLDDFAITES